MSRFFLLLVLGILFFTVPILGQYSADHTSTSSNALRLYCNRETAYSTGVSDARKGLSRKQDFAQICTVSRDILNAAYNSGYNFGLTNQSGLVINEPAPSHPANQYQLPSSQSQIYTRPVAQAPGGYAVPPGSNGAPTGINTNPNDVRNTAEGAPYPGAKRLGNGLASSSPVYPGEQGVPSGDLAKFAPSQGLQSLIEVQPSLTPKCIETVNGQACGFNCVNSLNNVRCAATPDQVCRSNEIGNIACGYHCISTSKTVRCAAFPTDGCVSDVNGYIFCGQNCRIEGNATAVCDIERYAP